MSRGTWANRSGTALVCNNCTFVHTFCRHAVRSCGTRTAAIPADARPNLAGPAALGRQQRQWLPQAAQLNHRQQAFGESPQMARYLRRDIHAAQR